MTKYTIINLEDISDDLPSGTYKTEVVSASWEEIKVRFINEQVRNFTDCLFKLVKD